MKKIIIILTIVLGVYSTASASYITKFNSDFDKKSSIPDAKGGIYPTNNPNFQRLLRKYNIMKICAEYSINLQFSRYAKVWRSYYVLPHTNSEISKLEAQLRMIATHVKRYTTSFLGKLKLTIYLARGFSYRALAGLASGRRIILGKAYSSTFHHEIGHVVHNTNYSLLRRWRSTFWSSRDGNRSNYVTRYAMTNYREDWAETYTALINYNASTRYNYVNLRNERGINYKIREKLAFMKKVFEHVDRRYNYQFWAQLIRGSSYAIAYLNGRSTTTVAVNRTNRTNNTNRTNYGTRRTSNTGRTSYGSGSSGSALNSTFGEGISSDGSQTNNNNYRNKRRRYNTVNRTNLARNNLLLVRGAYYNSYRQVYKALQNGANVNFATSSNWTALHYAAWRGNIAMIRLLISKGANVKAVTFNGYTPAAVARRYYKSNAYRYLLRVSGRSNAQKTSRRYYGNRYYNRKY